MKEPWVPLGAHARAGEAGVRTVKKRLRGVLSGRWCTRWGCMNEAILCLFAERFSWLGPSLEDSSGTDLNPHRSLSQQGLPLSSPTDGETEARRRLSTRSHSSLVLEWGASLQPLAPSILPLGEAGGRWGGAYFFIGKGPVPGPGLTRSVQKMFSPQIRRTQLPTEMDRCSVLSVCKMSHCVPLFGTLLPL